MIDLTDTVLRLVSVRPNRRSLRGAYGLPTSSTEELQPGTSALVRDRQVLNRARASRDLHKRGLYHGTCLLALRRESKSDTHRALLLPDVFLTFEFAGGYGPPRMGLARA